MRLYPDNFLKPNDEETNNMFLQCALLEINIKEKYSETHPEIYKDIIISIHETFRKILNLPNKLFTFSIYENSTKAIIVTFDKEPDGKMHNISIDEDDNPYVEIEEGVENSNYNNEQLIDN